jgi:hypothetical protein
VCCAAILDLKSVPMFIAALFSWGRGEDCDEEHFELSNRALFFFKNVLILTFGGDYTDLEIHCRSSLVAHTTFRDRKYCVSD